MARHRGSAENLINVYQCPTTTSTRNSSIDLRFRVHVARTWHPSTVVKVDSMATDTGRRANRSFGRIEIDRVQPDPDQPHVEFDGEALQNLTDSIREKGQLDISQ